MLDFKVLANSTNLVPELDDDVLGQIADRVIQGYESDEGSLQEWKDLLDEAIGIAKQTLEKKDSPFPNSSNVKYPLIPQAAISFASRIMPEIIKNDQVVQSKVLGKDPDELKLARSRRVGEYMSYQLLYESNWEEDLDKLAHLLPILGIVFKKTYFDPTLGRPVSKLCHPTSIVVDYYTESLERASRITHLLNFNRNDLVERARYGIFDTKVVDEIFNNQENEKDPKKLFEESLAQISGDTVEDPIDDYAVLEQHCYIDLDGDGYAEPYVVTVHQPTRKILRIVHRFGKVEVVEDGEHKGKVRCIEPMHYFTAFHFVPSPDGSFYSIGYGTLLYSLNCTVNTLLNQLIDAGTLSNNQSGLIRDSLRLPAGKMGFELGEWKPVRIPATSSLKDSVLPLPVSDPSPVLFQLLGLLIESGKDLGSATDALQGKQAATNVPATTILTLVEQGSKVYTAISKRIYRSLKQEFRKLFELNRRYIDPLHYTTVLDDPTANPLEDFEMDNLDILPVADPVMSTGAQRVARAEALLQVPGLNPYEQTKYYLQALQLDEQTINRLLPQPDPQAPPPPEVLKLLAEVDRLKAEAQALMAESQVKAQKVQIDAAKLDLQSREQQTLDEESDARIFKMGADIQAKEMDLQLKAEKQALDAGKAKAEHEIELKEHSDKMQVELKKAQQKPSSRSKQ